MTQTAEIRLSYNNDSPLDAQTAPSTHVSADPAKLASNDAANVQKRVKALDVLAQCMLDSAAGG